MFFIKKPYLLLVFLLAIILHSCQPKIWQQMKQVEGEERSELQSWISLDKGEESQWRAKVEAFRQKLTGILVLQKEDSSYRAVMITDFGLKVIDLQIFDNGTYLCHHIMKHLDYDFVKDSFVNNLRMLLSVSDQELTKYQNLDGFDMVYAPQTKMLYYWQDDELTKVERYRSKSKIWANAHKNNNNIIIEQVKPQLSILLKPL